MPLQHHFRFAMGPVQVAIAQARSLRDLWSGSYLLSWLTARAAAEALDHGATFTDPQWADSPLVRFHQRKELTEAERPLALRSALPNTFTFSASPDDPAPLADRVRQAALDEWRLIATSVHDALGRQLQGSAGWDADWQLQIDHAWTFRVDAVAITEDLRERALALGATADMLSDGSELLAEEFLARVGAAAKLLRDVPPHGDPADSRPKCSLTGDHAQMGPPGLSLADLAAWWEDQMAAAVQACGERLRGGERLGAPALVKRLAWSVSLSRRLGVEARELRTTDTATVAAGPWIARLRAADPPIPPDGDHYLHERESWSGQWLHQSDDPDEPVPQETEQLLREARRRFGSLPSYLAVLVMDGDHMGRRLGRCTAGERQEFTSRLNEFASRQVPTAVQSYLQGEDGLRFNQPVYAGGDDVLALLPLWMPERPDTAVPVSAVGLSAQLAGAFGGLGLPGDDEPATMSAGLAVVHFKTDLREALDAAREAEKAAKNGGRNRLHLAVCRRSGEHAGATLPWNLAPLFDALVRAFMEGASDRWAYRLRGTLDQLAPQADEGTGVPPIDSLPDMIDAEAARLLAHSDQTQDFRNIQRDAWDDFSHRQPRQDHQPAPARDPATLRNAITLIQSASFLARGREQGRSQQ